MGVASLDIHLGDATFRCLYPTIQLIITLELAIILCGLVDHLNNQASWHLTSVLPEANNGTGAVFAHIKDLTVSHAPEKSGNSTYITEGQVFHTDVGDLIALTGMTLEIAEEGGTPRIATGLDTQSRSRFYDAVCVAF